MLLHSLLAPVCEGRGKGSLETLKIRITEQNPDLTLPQCPTTCGKVSFETLKIRIFRVSKETLPHVVGHCGKVKSGFCSVIRIFRVSKEPLPRPSHTGARRECSNTVVGLNADFVQKSGFLEFRRSLCCGLHTPGQEKNVEGHYGKARSRFCSQIRIFRVLKETLPQPSHTEARRECSGGQW